MQCPDCGGAMWDNRADKRNPKSPDFKCKNKQCDKAVWEKKGQQAAPVANGNGNGHAPAPSLRAPLVPIYNDCLNTAQKACAHYFKGKETVADVLSCAATLFIAATRDGAPLRATTPNPAPPPPPPPPPEPEYDPYYDGRSLPF